MRLLHTLILVWICGLPVMVSGQVTLSDTLTVPDLVRSLIGSGVEISNLSVTCDTTLAVRQFDDNNSGAVNLNGGMLMSTGLATEAIGPNLVANQSTNLFEPGYAPLDNLSGQFTFDACVIEFDLVAYCDSLGIRYVFASEEYSEYVSSFNDAFAFYISGPGIAAPAPGQNIALVPGTAIPVSVSTVNNGFSVAGAAPTGPCTNCAYYVDNTNGADLEFDGYTVPLIAEIGIQACQTYHITLAIADAGDQFFDSGVFLEAAGIGCLTPQVSISLGNGQNIEPDVLVEGCVDTGYVTFALNQPATDTMVFAIQVGGTATSGLDYQPVPDSVVFLPGEDSVIWAVPVLLDALVEGVETLSFSYQGTVSCTGASIGDSVVFEIRERPFVVFPLPDTLIMCSGEAYSFNLPAQDGWSYAWNDTTGLDSPQSSTPTVTFLNQGSTFDTVEYILRVEALPGICYWSDTVVAIIAPEISPSLSLPTFCSSQADTLEVLGVPGPTATYTWDFGDGYGGAGSPVVHGYDTAGTYPVEVAIQYGFGCLDTLDGTAQVGTTPDAAFEMDTLCQGATYELSSLNPAAGVNHFWDMGNGQTSTAATPFHAYDSIGPFEILHVVIGGNGCTDSAIQLVEVFELPEVDFSVDNPCYEDSVLLTANVSSVGASIDSIYWQIPGGALTGNQVSYLFPGPGLQSIKLIATDSRGCQDSISEDVLIYTPPAAELVADSGCIESSVTFMSNVTAGEATVTDWFWSLQDTIPDTGMVITQTFGVAGTFPVSLWVVDSAGCRDTAEGVFTVFPEPVSAFMGDSLCEGQVFSPSPDSLNPTWNHSWIWGDGGQDNGATPSHLFDQSGPYLVKHVVSSAKGCLDSSIATVRVFAKPSAEFQVEEGCLGAPTAFTNLSLGSDWPLAITQWNFGSAGSSFAPNPSRTFSQPGTRTVRLIVVDQFGCRDTSEKQVRVFRLPQAKFSADSGCVSGPLFFQDQSQEADAPLTSWSWELGDGTTESLASFSHLYDSIGTYQVTLSVMDSLGCADTVTQPIWIFPLPEVSFSTEPACDGTPVQFISGPQAPGASYRWNFGDGTISTLQNPQYLFPGPGTYRIWLSVASRAGCADSIEGAVRIYQRATPVFRVLPACEGEPVEFQNLTLAGDFPITTYRWRLGDGTESNLFEPTHLYDGYGNRNVRLRVTDSLGCRIDTSLSFTIWAKPRIDFLPDTACAGSPVVLQDLSRVPDQSFVIQRYWTLTGNRRYLGNRPQVSFPDAGPYFIRLRAVTDQGCSDSLQREALVYPPPMVDFTFDTVCAGTPTSFTQGIVIDTSQFNDVLESYSWELGDGTTIESQDEFSHLYAEWGAYEVSLKAETNRGCKGKATQVVPVHREPESPVVRDTTICVGQPAFLLASPRSRSDTVSWYRSLQDESPIDKGVGHLTDPTLEPLTLWVESKSPEGCVGERKPVQARIHPDARVELQQDKAWVERPNALVQFGLSSRIPLRSYEWDFGDGAGSGEAAPLHLYDAAGVYRIRVRAEDENYCWYSLKSQVEVDQLVHALVPTAFSPNGDLVNDYFYIPTQNMQVLRFEVWSRTGQQVFSTDQLDFQWDGTSNGQPLPTGVYAYRLYTVDLDGQPREQGGTITLVR